MKRFLTLLLALSLLLCACGGKSGETSEPTTEPTTEATTEPTTEATEVTEPPVVLRHPLTGEVLDSPFTSRVTAIVINNLIDALPHYGVSCADMLYEVETEGGITRMLALFTDFTDVGSIGPVRSARTFFSNVAVSYDAPLIHCGGSHGALNAHYDDSGNTISNWEHVDQMYNGAYFFRDTDRYNYQGYAYEHTLFTKGELVEKCLEAKGFNKTYEEGNDFGLVFDEKPAFGGEAASKVTVTFRGGKTSTMTFNESTGLYEMAQYKRTYTDAGTDKVMAFRNVLVLYATQRLLSDTKYYRSYYDLIGSGEGHLAVDGKIIPIKWERSDLRTPFRYTTADGEPVTLGVGTSYVGIVGGDRTVSYE